MFIHKYTICAWKKCSIVSGVWLELKKKKKCVVCGNLEYLSQQCLISLKIRLIVHFFNAKLLLVVIR